MHAALEQNKTLMAVADLCTKRHVDRVITYNYDDLLEIELKRRGFSASPVWQPKQRPKELRVYHVHGLIRLRKGKRSPDSTGTSLVFTEEQYHRATYDPYSWANLIQLNTMSECVGLTVGLSMADPNMRRLLAAAKHTPRPANLFALLVRPPPIKLRTHDLEEIHTSAKKHLELFTHASGMKNPSKEFQQVESIVQAVHVQDHEMEQRTLQSLGVTPMWVDSVKDAQAKLADLVSGAF